jgi:hypothetical protein
MTKPTVPKRLLDDLRSLIAEARQDVAGTVNSALITLYRKIGLRFNQDCFEERRGGRGKSIVYALSGQLAVESGGGFAARSLRRMIHFRRGIPKGSNCRDSVAAIGTGSRDYPSYPLELVRRKRRIAGF